MAAINLPYVTLKLAILLANCCVCMQAHSQLRNKANYANMCKLEHTDFPIHALKQAFKIALKMNELYRFQIVSFKSQ